MSLILPTKQLHLSLAWVQASNSQHELRSLPGNDGGSFNGEASDDGASGCLMLTSAINNVPITLILEIREV